SITVFNGSTCLPLASTPTTTDSLRITRASVAAPEKKPTLKLTVSEETTTAGAVTSSASSSSSCSTNSGSEKFSSVSSACLSPSGTATHIRRAGIKKISTRPSSVHSATENSTQCSPASPMGTSMPIVCASVPTRTLRTTAARFDPSGRVLRAIRHRLDGASPTVRCRATMARMEPWIVAGMSTPHSTRPSFSASTTAGGGVKKA
ncbi:MAG: hypothetical protein ACK55Z_03135, partial [bacterium]